MYVNHSEQVHLIVTYPLCSSWGRVCRGPWWRRRWACPSGACWRTGGSSWPRPPGPGTGGTSWSAPPAPPSTSGSWQAPWEGGPERQNHVTLMDTFVLFKWCWWIFIIQEVSKVWVEDRCDTCIQIYRFVGLELRIQRGKAIIKKGTLRKGQEVLTFLEASKAIKKGHQ